MAGVIVKVDFVIGLRSPQRRITHGLAGIVPIQFWTRYCVSSTESVSRSRVSVMKSSAICAMVRVSPSKIVPEVPVPL